MNNINAKFGFSRFRLGALWGYYFPIVKWQMIIYLLIAILCAILELLPVGTFMQFSLFTTIWTMLPYLFMLAPLVFARNGDSRMIECQMPAVATEKFAFFAVYLLVVIPILVYAIPESALWLYTKIPAVQTDLMMGIHRLRWQVAPSLAAINILTSACGVMTCLCVVLRAKTNRILKSVISVLALQFVLAIIGGIYGFYSALRGDITTFGSYPIGIQDTIDMRMYESIVNVSGAWAFQLIACGIMAVYLIWILRTIYKTLCRGGLSL